MKGIVMSKKYWLFKSEPNKFSIKDLANSEEKTAFWNGVRNYQARNFLRDEIKSGDRVLFYHSNAEPLAVVGACTVVKDGYPDFTAFDPDSDYYDSKSNPDKPAWYMVDIKLDIEFTTPVTLEIIKTNEKLKDIRLLQRGNRLSVFPITRTEFDIIYKLGIK